jgi:TonB family protein
MRLSLTERPMSITWVELPKGKSDEIGLGIKKSEGLPKSTIEEQKMLETPNQQTLPPTKPKDLAKAPEARKSEMEKRPTMKIEDKNIRKAEEPKKTKKDSKIQSALAKIDKQLKNRSVVPESAQVKVNEEGYKYGTGTKPLKALPSDPEYLKYQAQVRWKIMREWIVPVKFTEEGGNLNARLEVLINLDGDVVTVRWDSRSGNDSFDQSALRAIKKASPFPKPPDKLAWEAYNEGFLVEFDPRIKARY